jgi:hypothetical protein
MQEILSQVELSVDLIAAIRRGEVEGRWHQGPPHRVEFVRKDENMVLATFSTLVAPPAEHLVVAKSIPTSTSPSTAQSPEAGSEDSHRPAQPSTSSVVSVTDPRLSALVDISIAKHLAKQLQPVGLEALIKHVHSEHPTSSRSAIERAVQQAFDGAPGGAKSVVEIPPRLANVVLPEWYSTSAVDRKRAANRISRLLSRQQLPFHQWMEYVDRDVYLDLHSAGGIMSGMSAKVTAAGVATAAFEDGEDGSSGGGHRRDREADDGHHVDDAKRKKRRIEHLKEIDVVDWEGAGSLLNTSTSNLDEVERSVNTLLAARRAEENEALEKRGSSIPHLMLASSGGFHSSSPSITQLTDWVVGLESRLSSHETVCSQLRHIVKDQLELAAAGKPQASASSSLQLAAEIQSWLTPQLEVRGRLLAVLRKLRFEISHQVREEHDRTFIAALLKEFHVQLVSP